MKKTAAGPGHAPECLIVPRPNGFEARGPATLAMIDTVCRATQEYLTGQGLSALVFDLCLGIREALANAVRHGARFSPDALIRLRLVREEDDIRVTVIDPGAGFDWRAALSRVADESSEGGRGLAILRDYFRSFTFNEQGNELTFVKELARDNDHLSGKETMKSEITLEGEAAVVKPQRDIVASMATEFRQELLDTINGGAARIVIDLAGVAMVDSMGVGVLIAAHNSLQKKGARLEVRNVSADILKLFRNMRLDQHFVVTQ